MINTGFLLGYPVDFKHICMVYPPKVKDIVTNQNYSIYSRLLTFSQEEIEDEYVKAQLDLKELLSPFEYILNNAYNNPQFKQLLEQAFFLFTHEQIMILFEQKQIVIGDIKEIKSVNELRILKEEDYFEFQNLIREAIGGKMIPPPNPNEDPRVKAIKAKARYRDYLKAKQGKGLNLKTTLSSICCMGFGLNPLNIGELSYAAIPALIATYQEKEKYELDVDSLLAGADAKKVKPKYWIRNLDE
jgi:predicted  nucleic acid-binding Zn-ribbon protein